MSFNIALSSLQAVTEQLGTISNNIANAATTGFKSSRTNFGALYAESQAIGVEVIGQTQSMTQNGTLSTTGRTLDVAIAGGGFLIMRSGNGEQVFTRAGVLNTDVNNYLVNASGFRVQGYPVDADGNLQTGALGDIQLRNGNLAAKATDSLAFVANLDANEAVPAVVPFDAADAESYNSTYTTRVYDSLGIEHTLTQYFVKTADNQWDAHYYVDGAALGATQAIEFSTGGVLTAPVGPVTVNFTPTGADPMAVALDYTGSTQFGSNFLVTRNAATGYTAGERTGLAIESNGQIYATYSNGQRMLQGQLVLANFVNLQGLSNAGGTAWTETEESGAALVGVPGTGQNGSISSGTLESSNVDLTQQLVGLMEAQRNYQATTRVLSTGKELNQVLFNAI